MTGKAVDTKVLIGQSEFFKGLSRRNMDILMKACVFNTLGKRECLFHEGARGEAIYFLSSGSMQLVKTSAGGREVVVKTVEPGETFAEVVLFERDEYPVTAIALKKSVVCGILKRDILGFFSDQAFRNDFIRMMMTKMRHLADRILFLTAFDVEQRFFRFFEEQYGRKSEYHIGMARKDIAAAVGIMPETLSRLLLRLKGEGKIALKGKTLQVRPVAWKCLDD